MFRLLVSLRFQLLINMKVSLTGNTPPDYRQTDMDLSDNEDNNCKFLLFVSRSNRVSFDILFQRNLHLIEQRVNRNVFFSRRIAFQ